ncbi:F-box/kelch-repeat protein At3g23880-like [Vicia villosa]|uniref:F-box/kelch-repeat protein At3g23880-like n=1 Tax=Vicia villosa TaxID=3911 RepID=UPI00273C53D6|nr:F-box/kelch-repeat protein At3g23880-like [Vicia villosa]
MTKLNHIPDDIVFSILSKLSLKSLKRFECVCKSWSLLFDNVIFMTMFRNYFISKNHSFYDDISFLLRLKNRHPFYFLSGERFKNIVKFDWPNNYSFDILGPISFNGTLCLHYYNSKIILWNPTTTEFHIIYTESSCFSKIWADKYQVGYDHVNDDYKIIRHNHCTPRSKQHEISWEFSSFWEIYSLNNNSWRTIDDDFSHSNFTSGDKVYFDGVSHWLDKTWLVSFDFIKEFFVTTPVPSCEDDVFDFSSTRTRILTVLNGSIAFIVNYEETGTFDILILGEFGVEESWTKVFIVGPLPCLKIPIGIGKKGNILIRKKDNELAWFDISTGAIDEIGVRAESDCKISFHKESLPPIGGI